MENDVNATSFEPTQNVDLAQLEQELYQVQRSTATTFPWFLRAHNWLRMHSRWYYRWHVYAYSRFINLGILIVYCIGMSWLVWFALLQSSGSYQTRAPVNSSVVTLQPILIDTRPPVLFATRLILAVAIIFIVLILMVAALWLPSFLTKRFYRKKSNKMNHSS